MLAHHGNSPADILMVLVPVSLIATALFFANRRASRAAAIRATPPAEGGDRSLADDT